MLSSLIQKNPIVGGLSQSTSMSCENVEGIVWYLTMCLIYTVYQNWM